MEEFEIDYEEILDALDIIRKKYGSYTFLYEIIDGETKGTLEHRKKLELFLNRKLKRTEYVHHINLNKDDNKIDNLWISNRAKHMMAHQSLRRIGEAIALILFEKGIVYFDKDKGIYKMRYKESVLNDLKNIKEIGGKSTSSDPTEL